MFSLLFLFLNACTPTNTIDEALTHPQCDQIPEGRVSLPLDDSPHAEPVEWWYWTGHLQDEDQRWYGFEHVFFLVDYGLGMQGTMTHHAVTDVDDQSFHYDVSIELGGNNSPGNGFSFAVGNQRAQGNDGADYIQGAADEYSLELDLVGTKAPVFQHGDGYYDYSFGGYTYYYSRERMAAEGTLMVDGELRTVSGTGWFDHQWGELNSAVTNGWDWFAIQLDDMREIMLFVVRVGDTPTLVGGSITDETCHSRELDANSYSIVSLGEWTSPATGCTYPIGWDLTVEDMTFTVLPVMDDQEVANDFETYWEGAATVEGDATGRAYIELTGYCNSLELDI